jgi:glycopeptide antibiotics resistance protein
MKELKYNRLLLGISFTIYIILLLWVVIFKWTNYFSVTVSINNFRHLDLANRYDACYEWFFYYELKDLILNVILFLPLGIFYLLVFKRKFLVVPLGFILIILLELSQFLTCIGMFNVYDIIGNMTGIIVGYIFYIVFNKIYIPKVINIINSIVITICSPIAIYAIYMTIKNIEIYI